MPESMPFKTAPEWELAMSILMDLCTEIPDGGSFVTRPAYTPKFGPTSMVVPSTGPSGEQQAPVTTGGHITEIPVGGGFVSREGYIPKMGPTMKEVPDNHPAEKGPRTALEWALLRASLNMKTDSNWQTRESCSPKWKGVNQDPNDPFSTHSAGPDNGAKKVDKECHDAVLDPDPGIPGMQNLPGGPGRVEGPDSARSLRGIHTTLLVQDDGSHGAELSMQDGSFFILHLGDLRRCIDQVQSMDDVSLDPKGHYQAIKNHIIKRATAMNMQHIIPANWQLSMAGYEAADADAKKKNLPPWLKKKGDDKGDDDKDDKGGKGDDDKDDKKKPAKKDAADAYADKTFSTGERNKLSKSGAALPDGSYPIENMADLHNAIQAFGRGKGDKATLRSHILSRAKSLKADPDLLAHIEHLGIG